MTASQLSNPASVCVGGHVAAYAADGARLVATDGAPMSVATIAALQALTAPGNGQLFVVQADGSKWRYASASSLTTDAASALVLTATGVGSGAYLREDNDVDLKLPVAYTTADAAVLYTVPAGFRLQLGLAWWEVTTSFTGGSSSAIGLKSSSSAMSTAGDVLGGSGGDVAATLVSTGALAKGTVGAKYGNPASIFVGGDTIVFDRITSAFTAGAGFAHVPVKVLLAPTS